MSKDFTPAADPLFILTEVEHAALELSEDDVVCLWQGGFTDWQTDVVSAWSKLFKIKPTVELQYTLVVEELKELAEVGLTIDPTNCTDVEAFLKEFADVAFSFAGMSWAYEVLGGDEGPSESDHQFTLNALMQLAAPMEVGGRAVHEAVKHYGWSPEVFQDAAARTFHRVLVSNLTKLDEDGKPILDTNGKVLKGPYYEPPYLNDLACRLIDSAIADEVREAA